jgi:hypothetical protein
MLKKLYFFVSYEEVKKARVFVNGMLFQSGLIFAYLGGATFRSSPLG